MSKFFISIILFNFFHTTSINTIISLSDSLYNQGLYDQSFVYLKAKYKKFDFDVNIVSRYARSIFMKALNESNIDKQNELLYYGLTKSEKALNLDPNDPYANFWYASYIGKIGQIEGFEKSIANSYIMKKYALKAINLDPYFSPPYFMMGRWHYEISSLNYFEKLFAETIYGKLPESSIEDAVFYLRKAVHIEPENIRYNYWLAKILSITNEEESKSIYKKILSLNPKGKEENQILIRVKKIIKENE